MIPTRAIDFTNAQIAKMSEHQLNLKRLADFLWHDPRPRQEGKFNMATVTSGWNRHFDPSSALTEGCNTAGCACGWAIVVLGELNLFEKSIEIDDVHAQRWMFSGGWKDVDNTPLGASFRIDHWLKHQDEDLYSSTLRELLVEHYPADLRTYVARSGIEAARRRAIEAARPKVPAPSSSVFS